MVAELVLLATLYSPHLTGRPMANGQPYNPKALTVAANTLPLRSKIILCTPSKCVRATVTDRIAPRFTHKRVDLSEAVARRLGIKSQALVKIYP